MRSKKENSLERNPLKILDNQEILLVLKKHWMNNHENLTEPEKFVEDFFEYLLKMKKAEKVDRLKVKKTYNRMVRSYWKKGTVFSNPKDMFLEVMEKDLKGVKTVLDFGCGKLAFMKDLAAHNKKVKKMVGIDPISLPVLSDIDGRIVFQRSLSAIKKGSIDLVVIKLVLHHLRRVEEVGEIFQKVKIILRPQGKLVVFEESFPESGYEPEKSRSYLEKFGLEMSEVTEDFMKLSKDDRVDFLLLNDWLMNVQNSYMPWTGLYKSMEEWRKIAELSGLKEKESHFLGAIKHRKRKQGMTVYMVFEK